MITFFAPVSALVNNIDPIILVIAVLAALLFYLMQWLYAHKDDK
jgi:hypothetical protein